MLGDPPGIVVLPASGRALGREFPVEADEQVDQLAADRPGAEQVRQLRQADQPVGIPGRSVRIFAVGYPVHPVMGLGRLMQELADSAGYVRHSPSPLPFPAQVPLACAVTACHGARARGWAWSWLAACEGTGFVDQVGPPGRIAVADDDPFAEGPARGSERLACARGDELRTQLVHDRPSAASGAG